MTPPATREELVEAGAQAMAIDLLGCEMSDLPLDKPELRVLIRAGVTLSSDMTQFDIRTSVEGFLRAAERAGCMVVPVEATPEQERAALESAATDDEGTFGILLDLLDFSGENKAHTVVREAIRASNAASPFNPQRTK